MKRSYKKFVERIEAIGLREQLAAIAAKRHITLQDLYEGDPGASVVAARKDAYAWLIKKIGKSPWEIGKLFDRAPNGILKLLRAK